MRQRELAMANILRQLASGQGDPCTPLFCLYWLARSKENRISITPGTVADLIAFGYHLMLMDVASAISMVVNDDAVDTLNEVIEDNDLEPVTIRCGHLQSVFEELAGYCLTCSVDNQARTRTTTLFEHVGRELKKAGS